jgi:hypothetical protein
VLVLVLIAGRPRISSPKIATRTATATLGSNHEAASEPHHTTVLSRLSPLPWFELTLSPISLVQLLPTHAVRLVVAFARSGDAEGNTIMSEEALTNFARNVRSSYDAPACQPAESCHSTVSLLQCPPFPHRGGGHEGTSRKGRHPITTKKSPAHRKLQPSSKSTSTNEQFRTRFHLT